MNSMEERIWARDNRQCRRCHRAVYTTYKMSSQGVIDPINRNIKDNTIDNLILVCSGCHLDLLRLCIEYPQKYLCQMELITQSKLQSLRDITPKYDIEYRYRIVCRHIQDLEEENNIVALPNKDQEHLIYLEMLKAKIEAEEIREVVNKK